MCRTLHFALLSVLWTAVLLLCGETRAQGIVADHHDCDIAALPQAALDNAKDTLHIAYGHTSHGSQLTTGMTGLVGFANAGGLGLSYPTNYFAFNDGGGGGALDLRDRDIPGASDLGNPDRSAWATATRNYLDNPANDDVNTIVWSWCGQADTSETNINHYLTQMNQLETDYPDVDFVYMTGHVNGGSTTGNLFHRNQQIRDYCAANDKILYDFADIESWDPDGNYYGDRSVDDACNYDSDGNGSRDRNWATDWQGAHVAGQDWYNCSSAHSQPLNANRKAYAAWALWADVAADVPTDGQFSDYQIPDSATGAGTQAALLDGFASLPRVATNDWRAPDVSETELASDVLSLGGLSPQPGDDLFVLEIGYDPDTGANVFLGWLHEDSGQWVNAVEGNSDGGAAAWFVDGPYDDDAALGHWGVDPSRHVVWAVLDHSSQFAAVVPEPTTLSLALVALMGLGLASRRRRQ